MNKNFFILGVFLIGCLSVFGQQEIKVVSYKLNTTDISVRTNKRDDPTGKPCALIKVQFPKRDAQFLGDIIGSVSFKTNEYWVYMPQSSNQLEIRLEGFKPLVVKFNEFETGVLESNQSTYELCLLAKEKDAPQMYDDGMVALAHKDVMKAFDYLTKAANIGYAPALFVMGNESVVPFDSNIDDIDPNDGDAYQEAYRYYKEGAEKGSPEAQYALAKMLMDYNEGKKFETQYGNNSWITNITKIEVDGKMLDDNYIWTLLEKSADAGIVDAQWLMISNRSWCEKAAKKGIAVAEYGMGMWYDETEGMNSLVYFYNWGKKLSLIRSKIKDSENRIIDTHLAFSWYEKSAKDGLNIAKWSLADRYQEGNGTQKDIEKAIALRKEAAEDGDISLQYYLANMFCMGVMSAYYDDGGWGDHSVKIEANMDEASLWFKKVLNHSDKDLIWLSTYGGSSIDIMLEEFAYKYNKIGKDKESIYWLQRAAEWGREDAVEELKEKGISIPKILFK
jgi:TPR repeat protein